MKRAALVVVSSACASACSGTAAAPPLPEVTDPIPLVDPTIGTGGLGFAYGSCFVGAAAPHGLVKLGPDTDGPFGTISFQHYSGYFAGDTKVQGFSQVHLHGAGASDYGVLSVMPVPAFDPIEDERRRVRGRVRASSEHAQAGVYRASRSTAASGSSSPRPRASPCIATRSRRRGAIVIDLDKTLSGGMVDAASIAVDDSAHEVTGQLHHLGGMSAGFGGYTIYFVARASAAWTSSAVWQGGAVVAGASSATGTKVGAELDRARGRRRSSRSACRSCRSPARARTSRQRSRRSTSTRSPRRPRTRGASSSAS